MKKRPRGNYEVGYARPPVATRFRPGQVANPRGRAGKEQVDHPAHYGGADNPYEAIKVIEAWGLGFCLGNAVKYIARAGRKPGEAAILDLKKAAWYLAREIERQRQAETTEKNRPIVCLWRQPDSSTARYSSSSRRGWDDEGRHKE